MNAPITLVILYVLRRANWEPLCRFFFFNPSPSTDTSPPLGFSHASHMHNVCGKVSVLQVRRMLMGLVELTAHLTGIQRRFEGEGSRSIIKKKKF